jgi:hypothetical protein
VSGYGLDNREIEDRFPAETKDFSSSLCVQNVCGAHPEFHPVGTGGVLSRAKARSGRGADHSRPFRAEVENEYELYILSLQTPA